MGSPSLKGKDSLCGLLSQVLVEWCHLKNKTIKNKFRFLYSTYLSEYLRAVRWQLRTHQRQRYNGLVLGKNTTYFSVKVHRMMRMDVRGEIKSYLSPVICTEHWTE